MCGSIPFGFKYFAGSRVEWLLPLIIFGFLAASLLIFGLRSAEDKVSLRIL